MDSRGNEEYSQQIKRIKRILKADAHNGCGGEVFISLIPMISCEVKEKVSQLMERIKRILKQMIIVDVAERFLSA